MATDDTILMPTWHPVKYAYNDAHDEENGAALLVSIACIEFDQDFSVPAEEITLEVPTEFGDPPMRLQQPDLGIEEYNVEVNVLGLRNLVSTGLLPIKKAYIKFSVKSVLPPAQAKAVNDIFTIPNEGGPDPNIRTTLKFTVNISADPYFCPRMTCTTYDKLYFEGMA